MMILHRMTPKQLAITKHLAKRGHAMTGAQIAQECGYKFVGIDTVHNLRDRGYIRLTDQGWLITEQGRLRAEE